MTYQVIRVILLIVGRNRTLLKIVVVFFFFQIVVLVARFKDCSQRSEDEIYVTQKVFAE